jgi:hypothetical protein
LSGHPRRHSDGRPDHHHRRDASILADKTLAHSCGAPEWLDRLADIVVARVSELVCDIPDGTEDARAVLATTVMGEILARTLSVQDAAFVAEVTNAVLAAHSLSWRLVSVS